ncbi:recombination regulator RecX [Nitrosomonas ureae]|uniref:Regulatory protein RecX n=1 Tax=Nitrosomonas ureae TaxID=44577 RepID=A0A1H5S5R5_9PROT|nr:recombination regulator RecX [Nitrosomonas ureae]SEF45956.1 regulatory protein [Nitrosomonas ureae]
MNARTPLEIRALRMLARREHSRQELERKLVAHMEFCGMDVLAEVLDKLEQQGYLSEKRAVEQIARTRRARFGSHRIVHELKAKGIDSHLIDNVLPTLKETELEAALNIWSKKFDHPPVSREERDKQIRFMMNRGFSMETIRQVLAKVDEAST